MKTGIVMQIDHSEAVVLTSGGIFKRIPLSAGVQVGDVVPVKAKEKGISFMAKSLLAAACLIIMLLGGLGGYRLVTTSTSLISMDVNPSFELELNRFGRVIDTVAYNQDAAEVLKKIDLKGLPYEQAIDSVLKSDAMKPYLEKNQYLDFAVYSTDREDELIAYLKKTAMGLTTSYPQLVPSYNCTNQEVVKNAHTNHMTPGKMLALQELKEISPDLDIEEYYGRGIGEIHGQIETCRGHGHQYGAGQGNDTGQNGMSGQNCYPEQNQPNTQTQTRAGAQGASSQQATTNGSGGQENANRPDNGNETSLVAPPYSNNKSGSEPLNAGGEAAPNSGRQHQQSGQAPTQGPQDRQQGEGGHGGNHHGRQ